MDIHARIERYSVRPNPAPIQDPEIVVVCGRGDLDECFRRAKALLPEPVRIVGTGVTVSSTWPEWVREVPGIVLTEIGAYRRGSPLVATQGMRASLRRWVGRSFAGATGEIRAEDALFACAASRFLQEGLERRVHAEGLLARHPHARFVVVPNDCALAAVLRALQGEKPSLAARIAWPIRVLTVGAGALAASTVIMARSRWRARESLDKLEAMQRRPEAQARARIWAALVPDLERVNRHVLDSVAKVAGERGELEGVLLIGSLGAGLRSESDLRSVRGRELWPGLGGILERTQADAAQIVVDAVPLRAIRGLAVDSAVVARSLLRIAFSGPSLEEGTTTHDLSPHILGIARLATLDVMRSRVAMREARELVRRRSFAERTVVFVGCSGAGAAVATKTLSRAGATTVDFIHGAGWDNPYGASETPADLVMAWTEPDAAMYRALGNRALQAGMPIRHRAVPQRQGKPRRILIVTSYCHRDVGRFGYPLKAFQDEVLEVPRLMREANVGDVQFRWRPHPADAPHLLQRGLSRIRDVEYAPDGTLESALEWADVVISSISTAIHEALFWNVPVFVHMTPEFDEAEVYDFISRSRCFFRATELVAPLREVLASAPPSLAPEEEARRALFGASGFPRPFPLDGMGDPAELSESRSIR